MISPKPGLKVLDERPPERRPGSPGVSFVRVTDARLRELSDEIARCEERKQLEALLGEPRYAIRGDLFSQTKNGITTSPDVVEHYAVDGCQFDLWFENGRMLFAAGSVG